MLGTCKGGLVAMALMAGVPAVALMAGVPAVALMAGVPAVAVAADSVALGYDIRKEGESIGREMVRIDHVDGGATKVEVKTSTRAKVLFLEFRYDHSRSERAYPVNADTHCI